MKHSALFPVVIASGVTCGMASGCAVASGNVSGGDALFDGGAGASGSVSTASTDAALADAPGCSPTWTALYADYFGPTGVASCTSLTSCHDNPAAEGTSFSGFLCGTTKDSCYQGVTGSSCMNSAMVPCPLVTSSGSPTMTGLYIWINKVDPTTGKHTGSMPLNGKTIADKGYVFSQSDLKCITDWISQGAQNN
ncbi:MAG TPA: hypothetical protein VKU41_09760 [Polyangiaceae bacterium]|nr:hypothetical protein [Polyangiaceae bacterium]